MKEPINKPNISLSKGSIITFFTSSVSFVSGTIASIILARALGPEGRGIATLILMIPPILMMFSTLGTEVSNVYFTGNKKYSLKDIASNSLCLSLLLGFLFIVIFFGVYKTSQFQDFLKANKIIPLYLWLAILSLPFNLLFTLFRNILLGREAIKKFNGMGLFQVILNLVLTLIFIVILKLDVLGVVICFVVLSLGSAILSFILIKKITDIKLDLNLSLLKDSLRYGGKAYFGNLAQFLNYRLDIFIVAYFLSPIAVGLYGVAVGLAERLWMIPGSIGVVLFPRISSVNNRQANSLTAQASRHTFFIVSLIALLLFLFAKPLINLLFGAAYLPSVTPFIILLPGVVSLSVSKILTSDLAGRGRPEFGTLAAFISLPITVILDIILIPKWGISGAAFASTVAYTLATIVVLIAFLKISGNSLLNTLVIKKEEMNNHLLSKIKAIILRS